MMLRPMRSDKAIKVLIVEDSTFCRQTFSEMLRTSRRMDVIGAVSDGKEAIRFLSRNKPDVITLDLEIPEMNGFAFLRWLMSHNPLPVLVVSAHSQMENVFKALELGAVDFLAKPTPRASLDVMKIQDDLLAKVKLAAMIPVGKLKTRARWITESWSRDLSSDGLSKTYAGVKPLEVVTIGASTGGPPAIQKILTQLPKNLPVTVAIAQHMPPVFTRHFAERLNKISDLPVKEARHEEIVQPGTVYVAPGGDHMAFEREKGVIRLAVKPRVEDDQYTPSIDALMKSAAGVYGRKTLGVLLTGMGHDGKQGMRLIKEAGGATLAEAEETSVVFGMPKEAIREGVVDKVLPLYDIAEEITRRCM